MPGTIIKPVARFGACLFVVAFCAGCWGNGYGRYVPSTDDARKALEAALTAWQKGGKPGKIETDSMAVQAVDARWEAGLESGQKLTRFEVLKEEEGDGPKVFSVRLTLANPYSQVTARYYVLGTGPVWVYQEEDYNKLSGS
jgi:hypothetical protein